MGCDIHLHTEVKIDGEWHHYSHPNVDRWYRLFGVMAGVRDCCAEPIIEPRGLPDDMSRITQIDANHWAADGHTHSWFGPTEVAELSAWLKENGGDWPHYDLEHNWVGYLFGNSWNLEHQDLVQDFRFIFWFDN